MRHLAFLAASRPCRADDPNYLRDIKGFGQQIVTAQVEDLCPEALIREPRSDDHSGRASDLHHRVQNRLPVAVFEPFVADEKSG